ncbi:MAG: CSLREA domain-containing protein [Chloroflexi bacterium]|nr:CSLREA domain-containing protein [Chloroflexota bacterium]
MPRQLFVLHPSFRTVLLVTLTAILLSIQPFTPLPSAQGAAGRADVDLRLSSILAIQNPAVIVVNSLADALANDGLCTLREAITAANSNTATGGCAAGTTDVDTIDLTTLNGTIVLGSPLPTITGAVTLDGPGAALLTVQRSTSASFSVLQVASGAVVTLDGMTLSGGMAASGGGVFNLGTLTLSAVKVMNNAATSSGGGIFNDGTLTLASGSVVSNNTAGSSGGGLFNDGGIVSLTNATVEMNEAGSSGGGIFSLNGALTLDRATVFANSAASAGGGLFNQSGAVTAYNTTVSTNEAGTSGGGLYNDDGTVDLRNATVADNRNDAVVNGSGTVTIANTLLGGNGPANGGTGVDCAGTLESGGYNLIENLSCTLTGDTTGSISGIDPQILTLALNGGSTQTHALAETSPARNAANPAAPGTTVGCEVTDQRGVERPQGERCDIGAYESVVVEAFVPEFLTTSPANGEGGVAVTRETILRFRDPINPLSIMSSTFSARWGNQVLGFTHHVSPDNRTVTLFYTNPLPASARITVTINGTDLLTTGGQQVDVDQNGTPGGIYSFSFDTLSLTVVPGTQVCGRVFASELDTSNPEIGVNTPLQGVKITVDTREADLFTFTDAAGNFCLNPAPAGRFFVHVDGRTATNGVPPGAYYPFVGKAWESIPGTTTNIGEVFLPLVQPGTLQTVSETSDTVIQFAPAVLAEFPEFADVRITVPADSLYGDDGTRGGQVGIAPVPPDRLPGYLPPGLNFPVVITIQTDNATNFDVPVPVCFPNLPDSTTENSWRRGRRVRCGASTTTLVSSRSSVR